MVCDKKVSVIIPCYNIEQYIGRCVDSILSNTYSNLEVICVNDGSTDGTSTLLHGYSEKDPRVIVVDKKNGGVVSSRNAGIELATGDFISFVDGDDWIHKQFFEVMLCIQNSTDADAVICNMEKTECDLKDSFVEIQHLNYSISNINDIANTWYARVFLNGRIYRRELIPNLAISTELKLGEDTVQNLLCLCSRENTKIAITPEKLYYYFQREGSACRTVPHKNKILVSEFLMENFNSIEGVENKQIILHEIIRNVPSYRYLTMFSEDRKIVNKRCKKIYDFCRSNWKDVLPLKYKVAYSVFYHCPNIYRAFRIAGDPTMLDWERSQKKLQKDTKKL